MIPGIVAQFRASAATVPPTWVSIGPTVASDSGAPLAYESEPRLVQMSNGNILMVYRRGSTHSGNDGYIAQRVSADNGATWGVESVIADDASGFDTRNQAAGIDPVSGRLIVFYSVYNAVGVVRIGTYFKTSTDNGASWSVATDISTAIGGAGRVPFGKVIVTSNGLMATFYAENEAVALFSSDGGQTWGSPVTVYSLSQARRYNEPTAVAIDDDRIVLVSRIDRGSDLGYFNDSFVTYKSSDGGLTWSAGAEVKYLPGSTILGAAAPADLVVLNGKVLTAWISRTPDNKFYYTELPVEDFFTTPTDAFSTATPREIVTSIYVEHSSVSTGTVAEYGYPCMQVLTGVNQNTLCAWYDMSDGTQTNTRLMAVGTPSATLAQQDPYMFYTMDNITGSTLNDDSGFGINGTIAGATQRAGQIDQELYFDGTDSVSGIGTTSTFAFIPNTGRFTISFIASLDAPNDGNARGFMGNTPAASGDRGFTVYWEDRAAASADRQFRFRIARGTVGTFATTIDIPLLDTVATTRYHWIIVGDGSTVSVYRNNSLVGSGAFTPQGTGSSTRTLSLGILNGASPVFPHLGAIDQLRMYRRTSGPIGRAGLFAETGL